MDESLVTLARLSVRGGTVLGVVEEKMSRGGWIAWGKANRCQFG